MHFPVEYLCSRLYIYLLVNKLCQHPSHMAPVCWQTQQVHCTSTAYGCVNGSNETSNLHWLVRSQKEESIYYNFWWWCYSSKKGKFCPSCVGDLCFIRSTQGRCQSRTPDQPFQCPLAPSPERAAWPKFESCTQSLSCPTLRWFSEGKERQINL